MGSKKREHFTASRNKSSIKKNSGLKRCCRSCVCAMGCRVFPPSGNLRGGNFPRDPCLQRELIRKQHRNVETI